MPSSNSPLDSVAFAKLARALLGEPNLAQSSKDELRFGTNGSMSVHLIKGVWRDHETGEGGGQLDLVERERNVHGPDRLKWLKQQGYLPNGKDAPTRARVIAIYDYGDFQVVRYEPKTFRQRRPNGAGGWIWNVKGVRRVPYRRSNILEANAQGRPIFLLEGEKDVDRLHALGLHATCNPGGAGKWRPELSEHFAGADAIMVPDNDDAGFSHINVVGAALARIAKRIRVLVLPGLGPKGDVSDWLDGGGTVEVLQELAEAAPDWMPPVDTNADPNIDPTKQAAADAEQKLIDGLAKLNDADYDRRREGAASELGIRRPTLDNARAARRAELANERGLPPLFGHWVVEPWSEEVDGDALLDAIVRRIRRHIVLTADQAATVALWIAMAWAHEGAAINSPILMVTSAEPNSGKTTLVGLISFLVPRGFSCVGISEAALYRSIELWTPTIIADEFDTLLEDNEPLRAVINSGWTRGSGVPRCIGDDKTPHLFPVFCPKVIGLKGRRLPDTTMSRCVIIGLKRRKPSEAAEKFKHIDDGDLGDLRRQAMRWSMDNVEALKAATPEMPTGFDNRLEDNWHLMLAVAERAGGEWPERARLAAIAIDRVSDAGDMSVGVKMLADIKAVFEEKGTDRVASAVLVSTLGGMEDRPWSEWKGGKPITANGLARILRPFLIFPDQIRTGPDTTVKGYQIAHFRDAFERYLP